MPRFSTHVVAAIHSERKGIQRVALEGGRNAYVLTALVGPVAVGDRVVVNTTAVDLGLGTGGWDVVHWNLSREAWGEPGPGHVMKLRYTSLQADTGVAEEQHPDLPDTLAGMPVVACTLHSQVAVVALVVRHLRPTARIAYVMTDGGALALALSDLVADLVDKGVIDTTITAGHAVGGDLEAVGVPSALVLARHVAAADVVVAGMGPGVVGTASSLGTTALEAAAILGATAVLQGVPILCVRASSADERPRHQGVSHHTQTVLRLVPDRIEVPVPASLAGVLPGSRVVDVPDVGRVLAGAGIRVTSMGRGPDEDPLFFDAASAAAVAACRVLEGS